MMRSALAMNGFLICIDTTLITPMLQAKLQKLAKAEATEISKLKSREENLENKADEVEKLKTKVPKDQATWTLTLSLI